MIMNSHEGPSSKGSGVRFLGTKTRNAEFYHPFVVISDIFEIELRIAFMDTAR